MTTCDVVVVGLGAMGSAATYQLARRGVRVIGIDRFDPPHPHGSSHGDTRITRIAVGEGSEYVPLVRRSHELWRELEATSGRELLVQCGGLVMGVPASTSQHGVDDFAQATRRVAEANDIPVEVLSSQAIRDRFGVFNVTDETGIFEPTAGYLNAPSCIAAQLEVAVRDGATIRSGETVTSWRSDGASVTVETDADRYEAASMVVAAGPWIADLVPELSALESVQRQVLYWFDAGSEATSFRDLPIYIWLHGTGAGEYFYGFPARSSDHGSVKVATETFDAPTSPDQVNRRVAADESARMYADHLAGRLTGVTESCTRTDVCLYTVLADFGFVIDLHPTFRNVVIASPCSGHGFKHSAAIGECAAQLALGGPTDIDLRAFSMQRFG